MSDAPRPEYEFSEADRERFRGLAQSMSFVGACVTFLLGGLVGVGGLGAIYSGFAGVGVGLLAIAAVSATLGWWTMSAGRSLSSLVRTHGRDIGHLMDAIVPMRRLFGFALVIVILVTMLGMLACAGVAWCTLVGEGGGKCFGGL
jgi:hypothetical protein